MTSDDRSPITHHASRITHHASIQRFNAFTLLELLTVIAIIGIIAAISLPVMHNLKPDPAATGGRAMLDALSRARQLAISQRTTVYMVFVPQAFWTSNEYVNMPDTEKRKATNLFDKQLIGYNFVSLRTLGDQPGRPTAHYLSSWRTLPEGSFIPMQKFSPPKNSQQPDYPVVTVMTNDSGNWVDAFGVLQFKTTNNIPFPSELTPGPWIGLPYIAFNYMGQLENVRRMSGQNVSAQMDEMIPMGRGSVIFQRDPKIGVGVPVMPSINELAPATYAGFNNPAKGIIVTNPNYNLVKIDWLTGRARLERQEVR